MNAEHRPAQTHPTGCATMSPHARALIKPSLRIALAVLVCLLVCLPLLPLRQARAQDSVYLEVGGQNRYDNYSTAWMYADGQIAYCALPECATPAEASYAKEPIDDNLHSSWREVIRAMLFYGYGGPGFDPDRYWPQTWYDGSEMTDARYAALTHILIAEAFSRSTESPALYGCSEEFVSWVQGEVIGMQGDSGPWKPDTIGGALRNSGLSGQYGEWFDTVMPDVFDAYMLRTGEGSQIVVSFTPYGYITLEKGSADPDITRGNMSYSLEGARYAIYDSEGSYVATMTTDAAGHAESEALSPGSYSVVEESAPTGYALGITAYEVTILPGCCASLDISDTPQRSRAELVIFKFDDSTGLPVALGSASLAGAQFEIAYYDGHYDEADLPETPTRVWTLETDADGKAILDDAHVVSGDELYQDDAGAVLALGTLRIKEVKAPRGYLLDPQERVVHIESEGTDVYVSPFVARQAPERAIRGDIDLIKVDGQSMQRLAGIPFKVTSTTTGEQHVLVTDENGYASTSASFNPHTQATNANDWLLEADGSDADRTLDPSAGIWFGLEAPVDDERGALPYDTYLVEELPCPNNEGFGLVSLQITIAREGYTVPLGTVDDNAAPRIETTLTDEQDSHLVPASTVTLVDHVAYENLTPGTSYRLSGVLMDAKAGEAVTDTEGMPIERTVEFTPTMSAGSQDVVFELDASQLGGASLVAFEELSVDGRVVASHTDLEAEGQTVHIPVIGTTATDGDTKTHEAWARQHMVIEDRVTYEGLIPGQEYEIEGTLIDVASGEPALDAEGNEIHATTRFTAEQPDGVTVVTFEFDGTFLAGHDLVAFEQLSFDGVEFAVHAEIDDEPQTVHIPRIATAATDTADGDHLLRCAPAQRIVDTVAYENLQVGGTYVLSGEIMNADGAVLSHAETSFVASERNGSVDLAFTLDGSDMEGASVVVFERLYQGDSLVASHCDMDDADQTLRFPDLRTQAVDPSDGDQVILATDEAHIVDHVAYTGLAPQKAYVLHATLMDKTTGLAATDAAGKPIEAVGSFIADAEEGEAEVVFTFDGRGLAGLEGVVFEQLDCGNELVAQHADLDDPQQTVTFSAPSEPAPPPATTTSHGVAKTGDTGHLMLFGLCLIAGSAVAAIAGGLSLRKRGKHSPH